MDIKLEITELKLQSISQKSFTMHSRIKNAVVLLHLMLNIEEIKETVDWGHENIEVLCSPRFEPFGHDDFVGFSMFVHIHLTTEEKLTEDVFMSIFNRIIKAVSK